MSSLEGYVTYVKPALDTFIETPSQENLSKLDQELKNFEWLRMKIFQTQILLPLTFKLDQLKDESQDLRSGVINCMQYVLSKQYLNETTALRSILVIVLSQVRDGTTATLKPNISEEMKLASILCVDEALRRSTTDVLEAFYSEECIRLIGQLLLTLVEYIAQEKYKKLVIATLECLMVVFYIHDGADAADVVLRNQVADSLFIFLPKIVMALHKTAMADDKVGERIKSLAIKALGRMLCIMFEETTNEFQSKQYDLNAFKQLFATGSTTSKIDQMLFGRKGDFTDMEARLKRLQTNLRSTQWIAASMSELRSVFVKSVILGAHAAPTIRGEYARMCALLLERCSFNLKYNFQYLLMSTIAMSEDTEESSIRQLCRNALQALQQREATANIFDEFTELILVEHLTKLPRILHRGDDVEQYMELLFLKGFVRNLDVDKLNCLLLLPKNMELLVMCLLAALDLRTTRDLLNEEYVLRQIAEHEQNNAAFLWRQFKHLHTDRNVLVLYDICAMLGQARTVNHNIFDYCLSLLSEEHPAMNELILLLTLMAKPLDARNANKVLIEMLLSELLKDKHWHLALLPDQVWRLKVNKPSSWYFDRTPGLYESGLEVRLQDCDSDDESFNDEMQSQKTRVSILDAQYNVLHSCIVLDALAHCATYIGETFDHHIFHSLHRVLLKLASPNTHIHQAANFAFVSMQKALKFAKASHFIESSTDYLTYHLNTLLKRSPNSSGAIDILSVVLQYSTRRSIPYLDNIFRTIRDECSKLYQSENVCSYLKVFDAFLQHIAKWRSDVIAQVEDETMLVDRTADEESIFNAWLDASNNKSILEELATINATTNDTQSDGAHADPKEDTLEEPKSSLPQHINMIKDILNQVVQFISSSTQTHQILALECLISGIPLLHDYEDELLPIVHLIWQPLAEKFRQKDALVLNRCFTLLNILGLNAKDFILKRSLNDIIPCLREFLKEAGAHSAVECLNAQTQEYKLQLKLLQGFAELIQNLQISGKHFNDICEIVSIYLSVKQPKELQTYAVQFYSTLRFYNGPFIYLIVIKRAHLKDYKENVSKILKEMEF